jgi:hypothetical protein
MKGTLDGTLDGWDIVDTNFVQRSDGRGNAAWQTDIFIAL